MSTGKDPKSMPGTAVFRDEYDRIFGDHPPVRGLFVSRCSVCDGAVHSPNTRLYECSRCHNATMGSIDARTAPPLNTPRAASAPIMVDRFYEGQTVKTVDEKGRDVVVDIGSRQKHRAYMKENGFTTADDYNKPGGFWERAAKERREGSEADRKDRREAIARAHYEIEERKRRR